MKTENISKNQFKKLEKLDLPNNIINTESVLYPYVIKNNWEAEPKILKIFHTFQKEYFANKLTILNLLDIYYDDIYMPELVLPERKLNIANEERGYVMPFIKNNANLFTILNHVDIDIKTKISFLKEVGKIIEKVHNIKAVEDEFFLGDIHESNFIYDYDEKMIKAVDLDGSKLKSSYPFHSKYLTTNDNIKHKSLQHKYKRNYNGEFIPNKNTEWYCFIIMVLNTISSGKIVNLSMQDYYLYLELLLDNGFDRKFLDATSAIYEKKNNINITPYLDTIPDDVSNVNIDVFTKKLKTYKL